MSDKPYDVGYGKPPKASQFKPGQSGNPKGRPKGTKNLATDLQEEIEEKILISESGQQLKTTKQRAMLKTLMAKALKGDVRAADSVIKLIVGLLNMRDNATDDHIEEDDLEILKAYQEQLTSNDINGGTNDE